MIENDPSSGRRSTSQTKENIKRIGELIRKDRCLSICAISEIQWIPLNVGTG